jgi:excisionase family DNA binding protein
MKLAELPEILTVEEVAEYLGLGRSTCYDAARRGELPVLRVGRRLLIPKARLEEMLGGGTEPNGGSANARP